MSALEAWLGRELGRALFTELSVLERLAEAMLVDPQGRGMLEVRNEAGFLVAARLSSKVPWGHRYIVPAGSEAEEMYSDPEGAR